MIERLVPKGRKIEIFARMNNIRNGWLSIGNQLGTTNLIDPILKKRYEEGILLKNNP